MMRTKKNLFAAVLGILGLGFTACSDSENVAAPGTLSVDPSYVSNGVETEVESAIIEVPVNCKGKWIAVVDSCNWLAVMNEGQGIHTGNGVIKLKVDENRTGVGRKNKLSILELGSDDDEIVIPVYQNNMYHGEVPTNGATASWFNNNSIGCGAKYTYFMAPQDRTGKTFEPTEVSMNNNIFNMATLENKQTASNPEQFYINSRIPVAELNDKQLVNSLRKSDSLNVELEMGCSFGFIEFQASGSYNSTLDDNSDYVNYSICREAPVLNSNLQVLNIATVASKDILKNMSDKKIEAQVDELFDAYYSAKRQSKKDIYMGQIKELYKPDFGNFFSEGFRNTIWDIYSLYYFKEDFYPNDSVKQEQAFQAALEALDSNYGPFFISGGQFGGSLNLYATVDSKSLTDKTQFSAEVTANISSLFELSGHAEFTSEGLQLYKKSDIVMHVYGGNASETADKVANLLGGEDMTRTDKLTAIMKDWTDSFAEFDDGAGGTGNPKKAAPILFRVTPIWTLFTNSELSAIVKKYFMEKYADKGIDTWNTVIEGAGTPHVEDILKKLSK